MQVHISQRLPGYLRGQIKYVCMNDVAMKRPGGCALLLFFAHSHVVMTKKRNKRALMTGYLHTTSFKDLFVFHFRTSYSTLQNQTTVWFIVCNNSFGL